MLVAFGLQSLLPPCIHFFLHQKCPSMAVCVECFMGSMVQGEMVQIHPKDSKQVFWEGNKVVGNLLWVGVAMWGHRAMGVVPATSVYT